MPENPQNASRECASAMKATARGQYDSAQRGHAYCAGGPCDCACHGARTVSERR